MVRHFLLLSVAAFALPSPAQVPDKPETWTAIEGSFLRNVTIDDPALLNQAVRVLSLRTRQQGSLPAEAVPLATLVNQLAPTGNANLLWRAMSRLLWVLEGEKLSEVHEVASSLNFFTDQTIIAPGELLHARIEPWFTLGRPLKTPCTALITVESADGKVLASKPPVTIDAMEDKEYTLSTANLKPGRYQVRYALLDPSGKELVRVTRPLRVDPDFRARVLKLREDARRVVAQGLVARSPRHAAAVESAAALADLMQRSLGEYVAGLGGRVHPATARLAGSALAPLSLDAFSIERDLPQAEKLVDALLSAKDPLATMTGDLRLALHSTKGLETQFCRVFVPSRYRPAAPLPLVLALHGEGADESYFFDRIGDSSPLQTLAEARGYIVVAPLGRGSFTAFEGPGQDEALEVLARIRAIYSIDEKRILILGHSSGAMAAWAMAAKPGAPFAGLAAFAGSPLPSLAPFEAVANLPVFVAQGAKDTLKAAQESSLLSAVAQKRMKSFTYLESPADDHYSVTGAALPAAFDFFDSLAAPQVR